MFAVWVGLMAACNGTAAQVGSTRNSARLARPVELDLTLPTTTGRRFTLSSLRGRVVLLTFFTTGCVPCQALFGRFRRVQAAYGAARVAVVGIAVDRQVVLVRLFAQALALPFPILVAGSTTVPATKTIRVRVVPTTMILDRRGRVNYVHRKLVTTRRLAREVAGLLKGSS